MQYKLHIEETRPSVLVFDNIVYANRITIWGRDYHPLKINLVVPHYDHHDNPPTPLMVWIEGGGWRNASPAIRLAEMSYYAYHGIAVADVEYSVDSNNLWPTCLTDIKEAIRFLRHHHKQFNIDPERIMAAGDSAGAHLAALVGLTGDDERFKTGEYLDLSDSVKAAACFYGPLNFPHIIGADLDIKLEDLLVGRQIRNDEKLMIETNPMSYVRPGIVPFLFFHGDSDDVVYPRSSLDLYDKLIESGNEADHYLIEGAGHCESLFTQEKVQEILLAFIKKHIG